MLLGNLGVLSKLSWVAQNIEFFLCSVCEHSLNDVAVGVEQQTGLNIDGKDSEVP